MAKRCTQINEWIEEEVSKPIEEWVEKREKKCKEYPWYDPRGWVCWFVTTLVKVVRWVTVKVWKWVVRTVCKLISASINYVSDLFTGLWDIIAGIFTLDWRRILDGFLNILGAAVQFIFIIVGIVFLGDTIAYIISEIEKDKLRKYVKGLLEAKYQGENLENIKQALRVDHGVFGLRLTMTAVRTFLDSETRSQRDPSVPNLVDLHEQGDINLKELAGFEFNEGFWNRKRYKTLKKGITVSGGGGDEPDNPISESELDRYISSRGSEGPTFIILPMSLDVLNIKLEAGEEKGRELGLIPSWKRETIEVTAREHIIHARSGAGLVSFLRDIIGRTDVNVNERDAIAELCNPVAVAVFRYEDGLRGISACLRGSSCQSTHAASGVTFIDNFPDRIWKYVPIHELGHYFGLCHVDGVDRIMYSAKENSWFSWTTFPNLLYLNQEPKFTLSEAKQTWDYIVAHFSPICLGGAEEEIRID